MIQEKHVIEDVIYYHNKLVIPKEKKLYMKILRDADKISILHLFSEDKITLIAIEKKFSQINYKDFCYYKCINNKNIKNDSDRILKFISFIFDLNYKDSLDIVKTKYLNKIFEKMEKTKDKELAEIINNIKKIVYKYIAEKEGSGL